MASFKPVVASLRVLDVLSAVNKLGANATVSRIVQLTGLDKATTIRMLQTLIHAGYAFQDSSKVYCPTGKTLELSNGFDHHKVISNYLAKPMERLYDRIDWPSDLAVLDGDEMLIVSSSRLTGSLSFDRKPFHRAPILATSLGLSYMAHCDEDERQAALAKIEHSTEPWNKPIQNKKKLTELFHRIRSQGFATMEPHYRKQEFQGRVDSIGVPILVGNKAIASINVIYLRSALEFEQAKSLLLPELQSAAEEMGELLANSGAFAQS